MSEFAPKLSKCWHPVGYGTEIVAGTPYGTMLLDQPVVIWRDSSGTPNAARDVCIHRGTALSLGWQKDDCLVCPYHAWEYAPDGTCVNIPQRESDQPIPSKARLDSFECVERYGLVWVALEDPIYPMADIPELEDDEWRAVDTGPFPWKADASRQIENFTDFGHFPWVHPGLLGDPERPLVPETTVERDGHILRYSVVRPEAPNTDDFPVFGNEVIENPLRRSNYQLQLPYTIVLRLGWGGEAAMVYFYVGQPMTSQSCRGYCIIGRNYNLDQPDSYLRDFEETIFEQDRRIVESQRPDQVPFDLADELHLKFDTVAVNYRRAMQAEELAYWHVPRVED